MPRARGATRFGLQLVVLSLGGAVVGGLLLLALVPTEVEIGWVPLVIGASLTLWLTIRSAHRIQPRR